MPKAFDLEGVPKQRVTIVEDGVAKDVVWDRRTAKRAGEGRESTGHALTAPAQGFGPLPLNLSVRGGDVPTAELPGKGRRRDLRHAPPLSASSTRAKESSRG